MRTTVRLDDHLLRDLKKYAAAQGRSLTAVIDEAVRQFLARSGASAHPTKTPAFRITPFHGRLRPGLDLDDSAALLDFMEDGAAPRRR